MSLIMQIILIDFCLLALIFLGERFCSLHIGKEHLCNGIRVAFLFVWIAGIVYISFFYDHYSHESPDINLVPFCALYESLVSSTPLIESRFVFQFFLFLPLGTFVGVITWKHKGLYKLAVFGMIFFCILVEAIQYLALKKDCYADDVIAGILGILIGHSATILLQYSMQKKRGDGSINILAYNTRTVSVCKDFIICICGIFVTIYFFQFITSDGIFPYSSMRIPLQLNLPLQKAFDERERQVYAIQSCDNKQKCEMLANHFKVLGDIEESDGYDVYIRDKVHGSFVSVRSDGTWTYLNGKVDSPTGGLLKQSEYEDIVISELKHFLGAHETLEVENVSYIADATECHQSVSMKVKIVPSSKQHDLVWHNWAYVSFKGKSIISIDYCLIRCTSVRMVSVISAEKAFATAKLYGLLDYDHYGTGFVVEKVEYDHCSYREEVYPCYIFSGTYIDQNGITQQWQTTVDAVDRGVLPYVVPSGVLLIIFIAVVITIWRKKPQSGRRHHLL